VDNDERLRVHGDSFSNANVFAPRKSNSESATIQPGQRCGIEEDQPAFAELKIGQDIL
jgi:hypothetical protein